MPDKSSINPATGLPYAVNPATGVWDDSYWATVVEPQLRGGGGQSLGQQSYGGGGGNDVLGLASQIAGFGQQQTADVKNSLQDRYKSLLDQVGQQASRELGARGIPISSDSAQQFIQGRQLPVAAQQNADLANFGYQNNQAAMEAALRQLELQNSNQYNMGRLDLDRQAFEYQKQQNALSQQSLGGLSGGMGGMQGGGGFQPTSARPTGAPGAAPRPTAGFQPIGTTQQAANNPFQGAFSGANVKYAGQLASKAAQPILNTASRIAQSTPQYRQATSLYNTAQNVARSQPVQNFVKGATTVGKNIASGATNLFKSFFG